MTASVTGIIHIIFVRFARKKAALKIDPIQLSGNWAIGWALDNHTLSSRYDRAAGFYRTERTELGEALYRLKYKKRWWRADNIAETAAGFLVKKQIVEKIDLIAAIPPAHFRLLFQPVYLVARKIGRILGKPVDTRLFKRIKKIPPVKFMEDRSQRQQAVKGLFELRRRDLYGKNVLIFDDLYRSGMTLREASATINASANVAGIYVLTVTRTRVKR